MKKKLTETELLNLVWEELNRKYPEAEISKRTTKRVVKTFLKVLSETLMEGKRINFPNFGTFYRTTKRVESPNMGVRGKVYTIRFKPSRNLKRSVMVKTT